MASYQGEKAAYSQQQQAIPQQAPLNNGAPNSSIAAPPRSNNLPAKFQYGLFDCFSPFSLCCLACWCPCIAAGQTYAMENGEQDPSGINGMCCAWYCIAHLGAHACLQCINRNSMERKYGMDANMCTDFAVSCCCCCCTLVQEHKEATIRNTGIDPKTDRPYVYKPVDGMNYA